MHRGRARQKSKPALQDRMCLALGVARFVMDCVKDVGFADAWGYVSSVGEEDFMCQVGQ